MNSMTSSVTTRFAAPRTPVRCAPVRASLKEQASRLAQAAGAAAVTLGLTLSAHAGENVVYVARLGTPKFMPNQLSILSGETIKFVSLDSAERCNVVFKSDKVPPGVDADALSNKDTMKFGEEVDRTFNVRGEYVYVCEALEERGMFGFIYVS